MDDLKLTAKIEEKIVETPDVVTLRFTVDGAPLAHEAGQYVSVYFDDTGVRQGKAYSLSSCPGDSYSSITVKKIGLFSGRLHELKVGDALVLSRPYGFFRAYDNRPIVAIASGVGISPVWSIIRHELKAGLSHPVRLLYTNKTSDDIIFADYIERLSRDYTNFLPTHFVTRQPDSRFTGRRIDLGQDLIGLAPDSCFYICGTQDFVRSMRQQLLDLAVGEDSISTETFFEARV